MRIHVSDKITSEIVWQAINYAGAQGEVSSHGSRKNHHAFEVSLTGDSRRRPNFGKNSDLYAATWDQWGVFFGYLFDIDPDMSCWAYRDDVDFHFQTDHRFDKNSEVNRNRFGALIWPADTHGDHTFRYAGIPYENSCTKCSARKVWGANQMANV